MRERGTSNSSIRRTKVGGEAYGVYACVCVCLYACMCKRTFCVLRTRREGNPAYQAAVPAPYRVVSCRVVSCRVAVIILYQPPGYGEGGVQCWICVFNLGVCRLIFFFLLPISGREIYLHRKACSLSLSLVNRIFRLCVSFFLSFLLVKFFTRSLFDTIPIPIPYPLNKPIHGLSS